MRKTIIRTKMLLLKKSMDLFSSRDQGFFLPRCLFCLLMMGMLSGAPSLMAADTMLLFVGEDLEVLSLASRREEAAWNAPAIADVITKENIESTGNDTISGLLEKQAGFYINERERGSVPYLRGVPDSALFLYDTVPMGSAASKSVHNIDNETSVASIKRIEIVRGAGSVLWGPDAFAGVVNVVPLTGKDFQGIETGIRASSLENNGSAFLNYGMDNGQWNSFLSLSAKTVKEDDRPFNVTRFWHDGKTAIEPDERFGESLPGNSKYYELYSNASFDNWLTLSARLSDNNKIYTVSDWSGDSIWKEERSNPAQTFKIEASKSTSIDSGIRFAGYYTNSDVNINIIDKDFNQSEQSLYAELIYDMALFKEDGLLTTGVSWRKTSFNNILVWKSFMPGYLNEANIDLLPLFEIENYGNRLTSVFGQYRHRFSNLEIWAGLRNDDHAQLEDKISYNAGLAWDFSPNLIFKTIYGTAYRIPSAGQLTEGSNNHLERIESANAQIAWKSGKEKKISLTLFRNKISNHVIEDRYAGAGLSSPNNQSILGAELEWKFKLFKNVFASGNITTLNNSGPDETYYYGRYKGEIFNIEDEFDKPSTYQYDYDTGANTVFNASLNWKITEDITLTPGLRYISETKLYYLYEEDPSMPTEVIEVTSSDVWLMNTHLKINNIFPFSMDLFVENLWNETYKCPGMYTVNSGKSFNAGIIIKMDW